MKKGKLQNHGIITYIVSFDGSCLSIANCATNDGSFINSLHRGSMASLASRFGSMNGLFARAERQSFKNSKMTFFFNTQD